VGIIGILALNVQASIRLNFFFVIVIVAFVAFAITMIPIIRLVVTFIEMTKARLPIGATLLAGGLRVDVGFGGRHSVERPNKVSR
jgi:hypothetical protein